jgi:hypothetical protein
VSRFGPSSSACWPLARPLEHSIPLVQVSAPHSSPYSQYTAVAVHRSCITRSCITRSCITRSCITRSCTSLSTCDARHHRRASRVLRSVSHGIGTTLNRTSQRTVPRFRHGDARWTECGTGAGLVSELTSRNVKRGRLMVGHSPTTFRSAQVVSRRRHCGPQWADAVSR